MGTYGSKILGFRLWRLDETGQIYKPVFFCFFRSSNEVPKLTTLPVFQLVKNGLPSVKGHVYPRKRDFKKLWLMKMLQHTKKRRNYKQSIDSIYIFQYDYIYICFLLGKSCPFLLFHCYFSWGSHYQAEGAVKPKKRHWRHECWSKNRGVYPISPKMEGENKGSKPYFLMDDLGVFPLFFPPNHQFFCFEVSVGVLFSTLWWHMGVEVKIEVGPQNGWFIIMDNHIF